MTNSPKTYLDYLEKEMTIMGLLSAFSMGLAAFVTDRIFSAKEQVLLVALWSNGKSHVIAGAIAAVLASFFFYKQRSHLAWYYGQIALAEARGQKSPRSIEDCLTDVDGWNSWLFYQTGFIILALSFFFYFYAAFEVLNPKYKIPPFWSIGIPAILSLALIVIRWHVLNKYPQEDDPWSKLRSCK